jgi:protocatechuate 3,4-dioxygenase beta subunit
MNPDLDRRQCLFVLASVPVLATLQGDADEPRTTPPPGDPSPAIAQKLEAARTALKRETLSTNDLLSRSEWQELRPYTAYRDLIRENASTSKCVLVPSDEPGERLTMTLRIVDADDKSLPKVLVYAYQTSAKGWYATLAPHVSGDSGDEKHARLFGYARTNEKGEVELDTVRPGGYPRSTLPQHIHVELFSESFATRVTEVQFDDDARLTPKERDESKKQGFTITKPTRNADGRWSGSAVFALRRK